jgi:hypothetical protein
MHQARLLIQGVLLAQHDGDVILVTIPTVSPVLEQLSNKE